MQIEVVTAKFRGGCHGYYFSPNGHQLHLGDKVIVETEKGKDIVTISKEAELIDASQLAEPLKNVLKVASKHEIQEGEENFKKAQSLLPEIKTIVKEENLPMKVISVEANYNFSRLSVLFTAEDRVDFRDLVKLLAEKYKVRIELRQIGPRDATRILGGLGPCGQVCCCHKGFGINDHISIKMAKNQGLSLNPNSISGLCGKMLCCLAYENEYYAQTRKEMPKQGSMVWTKDGEGKVVYNDILKKTVSVKYQTETTSEIIEYSLSEINFIK